MKATNHLVAVFCGAMTVGAALSGCGHAESDQAETAPLPAVQAVVERLAVIDRPHTFEAVGTVRPEHSAAVSSRMTGAIEQVHVRAGDTVRQGQLLAELDARDVEQNLRQAEAARAEVEDVVLEAAHAIESAQAQLQLAEVTHQRYADLLEKRSVSRQEYDEAEARLESAKAALEMANARKRQAEAKRTQVDSRITAANVARGYARIVAPFAGIVTERLLDPGSLATPGAPILRLEQSGSYRMEAAVPESRLGAVREGQSATVRIDALDDSFAARVNEIVPALDTVSRTFTVKLTLPRDAKLKSGLFGRAIFSADPRPALTVPASAVMTRGQIQSVFVVEEGMARRRLVSLGTLLEERYEVLSGLEPGEQVITEPGPIRDGQPVEIRQAASPAGGAARAAGDTP